MNVVHEVYRVYIPHLAKYGEVFDTYCRSLRIYLRAPILEEIVIHMSGGIYPKAFKSVLFNPFGIDLGPAVVNNWFFSCNIIEAIEITKFFAGALAPTAAGVSHIMKVTQIV